MGEFYMRIEYGDVKKEIKAKYNKKDTYMKVRNFFEDRDVYKKIALTVSKYGPTATGVIIVFKCNDFKNYSFDDENMNMLLSEFLYIDCLSFNACCSCLDLTIRGSLCVREINIFGLGGDINIEIPCIINKIIIYSADDSATRSKKKSVFVVCRRAVNKHGCYLELYDMNIENLNTNLSTLLDNCKMVWNGDNILTIKELRFTECPVNFLPSLEKTYEDTYIDSLYKHVRYPLCGELMVLQRYIENMRNAYTAFLPLFRVAPGAAMDILKSHSSMFDVKPNIKHGKCNVMLNKYVDDYCVPCRFRSPGVDVKYFGIDTREYEYEV